MSDSRGLCGGDMNIYAVTGKPVAHSLSPRLFNHVFAKKGMDAVYTRLGAESAEEALSLARQIGIRGMNVTSPFKDDMARLMDVLDSEARETGAVNCVVFSGGRALGYNTDVGGVADAFRLNGVDLRGKNAAVLGTGGAGRAAFRALVKEGANVTSLNRTFSKARDLARRWGGRAEPFDNLPEAVAGAEIVVSAVATSEPLLKPEWLRPGQAVLDANYKDSSLPAIARDRGCRVVDGLDWLLSQAVPAFEILTGCPAETESMREAFAANAAGRSKAAAISLIGMMGAGKSTIGEMLSAELGCALIDLDVEIVKATGIPIPRIFREKGEAHFRMVENETAGRVIAGGKREIYSLGGGALMNPRNRELVKNRSFVIWLWAETRELLKRIPAGGRPLLENGDRERRLVELMSARLPDYARASDLVINTNGKPKQAVRKIIDEIH